MNEIRAPIAADILFWVVVVVSIVNILTPWNLRTRMARYLVLASVVDLLLYLVYEFLMPIEMNIRVDLFILHPLLGLSVFVSLWRVVIISRGREDK
jgi:hypothetical protein